MRGDDWKPLANAAMDRYAMGDDAAFEALYALLAPRLHAFLLRRTRDPARVEDLVQQTFLQMHCARSHFTRGAQVMPWAFAIARRLLIDGLRKGRRESFAEDGEGGNREPASPLDAPDAQVATRRLARRIEEELARLPEAHRIAFELVQCDGLSMAEAAQVLGTTATAVKLRAHRTYVVLRERLGDHVREELREQR